MNGSNCQRLSSSRASEHRGGGGWQEDEVTEVKGGQILRRWIDEYKDLKPNTSQVSSSQGRWSNINTKKYKKACARSAEDDLLSLAAAFRIKRDFRITNEQGITEVHLKTK